MTTTITFFLGVGDITEKNKKVTTTIVAFFLGVL
jgi:hypothetical protein